MKKIITATVILTLIFAAWTVPAVCAQDQSSQVPDNSQESVDQQGQDEQDAGPANVQQTTPPSQPSQEQPEVLTSGPVHEAFAEPVDLQNQQTQQTQQTQTQTQTQQSQTQQSMIVTTQPPQAITENPPNERPQGGNYSWIPGYWAWDTDRNAYIWVSACWRAGPPNTYWVPGYWAQVSGGWQWVAGYWAPVGQTEIEYLPPPPAIDVTVPLNSPNPDSIWVPPCWYWRNGQYVLRAGYWVTAQTDWVWVPSHYLWTPRGYVFAAGYWDYPLRSRGVLFAPVYFRPGFHFWAGFTFSPNIVVGYGALSVGLFTCPRYNHYFFGDYYDDVYISFGIYPWFECERNHWWYDPVFEHDRWQHHRKHPDWVERQRHEYDRLREDRNLRPAKTYGDMETRLAKMSKDQQKNFRTAESFKKYTSDNSVHMKFEKMNSQTRQTMITQAAEADKFRQDRGKWESEGAGAAITRKGPQKPSEQKVPTNVVPQLQEQKKNVTPPNERRESTTVTSEHKGTEEQSMQQRGQTERKEQPSQQPSEQKGRAAEQNNKNETENAPAAGENKSERVKVPESPIRGRSEGKKDPPPAPNNDKAAEGASNQQQQQGQDGQSKNHERQGRNRD